MTRSLKKSFSIMASCRGALLGVAVLSGLINLLYLSGSIFMMEVYDRVLPSRSIPTLVGLSVIIVVLYLFQGLFDMLRGRIFARVGAALDEDLSQQIFHGQLSAPIMGRAEGDGQQPLRDLDQIRAFLAGGGPSALFDLPWMPLYLFICFAFHPWIGLVALGGACLLVVITLLTEVLTREASKAAVGAALVRNGISDGARRNAEVVHAMGMAQRIGTRWGDANARYLAHPAADLRRGGRLRRPVEGAADAAAIGRSRRRRLSRHRRPGDGRHHDRLFHPDVAGPGPGRTGDRQLEGLRRRPSGLAPSQDASRGQCPRRGSAEAAGAAGGPVGGERRRRRAGCAEIRHPGCLLRAEGRKRRGRHRPERLRQVVARPHARRRVADLARQGAARRRGDRAMAAGGSRAPHRLSAAGRGAVRRNRGAEHRALRAAAEGGGGDRRRQGGQRPRDDPAAAGRLRDAGRRGRGGPVRRPAPAHRPGARALRRSLPGRARRAELESRQRRRAGAHRPRSWVSGRAAASSWSSPTGPAPLPASTLCS